MRSEPRSLSVVVTNECFNVHYQTHILLQFVGILRDDRDREYRKLFFKQQQKKKEGRGRERGKRHHKLIV